MAATATRWQCQQSLEQQSYLLSLTTIATIDMITDCDAQTGSLATAASEATAAVRPFPAARTAATHPKPALTLATIAITRVTSLLHADLVVGQ